MCLLFETIFIKDGEAKNLHYHNRRMNQSRTQLFNSAKTINIQDVLSIPLAFSKDIVKCKIIYNNEFKDVSFVKYKKRNIDKFFLIDVHNIDYNHKYFNRNAIEKLKQGIKQNEEIIIVKNNLITDTSFSNLAFFDGSNWFTPTSPLLKGTKREFLIENNKIKEAHIHINDLHNFKYFKLVNAMLDFETETLRTIEIISNSKM